MASVFKKHGNWYLRYRDSRGRWCKRVCEARTKTEATRLANDLERRGERQRLGVEPLPPGDDGETVGEGDFSAQAEQVFKNIQAALESVGSNMNSIMKMNTFMTHREDIPAYRVVRNKYVPDDALPVSTLILCSGLADPAFRIEVEVIATIA